MPYEIERFEVWSGAVEDRSGALGERLKMLSDAGINLQFVMARRDRPGQGLFYVYPIKGAAESRTAKNAGLQKAEGLQGLRVTGEDRAGLGYAVTRVLAEQNINARGFAAMAIGGTSAFYILLDNKHDATKAEKALKKAQLQVRENQPEQ